MSSEKSEALVEPFILEKDNKFPPKVLRSYQDNKYYCPSYPNGFTITEGTANRKLDFYIDSKGTPMAFGRSRVVNRFYVKKAGPANIADADIVALSNNLFASMISQSVLKINGKVFKTANYVKQYMDAMSWIELSHSSDGRNTYIYYHDKNSKLSKTRYTSTSTSTTVMTATVVPVAGTIPEHNASTTTTTTTTVDNADYNDGYQYRHDCIVGAKVVTQVVDISLIHRFFLDFDKYTSGIQFYIDFTLTDPVTWINKDGGQTGAGTAQDPYVPNVLPLTWTFSDFYLLVPQVQPSTETADILTEQLIEREPFDFEYEDIEVDLQTTTVATAANNTLIVSLPNKTSEIQQMIILMQSKQDILGSAPQKYNHSLYGPNMLHAEDADYGATGITSVEMDLQINKVPIESEKVVIDIGNNDWARLYDAYKQFASKHDPDDVLLSYDEFKYYMPYIVDLTNYEGVIPSNGKSYSVDLRIKPAGGSIPASTNIYFISVIKKSCSIKANGVSVDVIDSN